MRTAVVVVSPAGEIAPAGGALDAVTNGKADCAHTALAYAWSEDPSFIFGSSKDLRCNFAPNAGMGEHYVGSISKFGVDIGYTSSAVIVWAVVAPTSGMRRGALQGDYAGATASVTAGVGVGAHVLVGGLDRSVTLQPLSVEGNTGLNVAGGIGAMTLKYTH